MVKKLTESHKAKLKAGREAARALRAAAGVKPTKKTIKTRKPRKKTESTIELINEAVKAREKVNTAKIKAEIAAISNLGKVPKVKVTRAPRLSPADREIIKRAKANIALVKKNAKRAETLAKKAKKQAEKIQKKASKMKISRQRTKLPIYNSLTRKPLPDRPRTEPWKPSAIYVPPSQRKKLKAS